MNEKRAKFVIPVYLMVLGVSWLLNASDVVPGVNWIWTTSLASVGILAFVVWGMNKVTAVFGPLLVIASICSFLKQIGSLETGKEVPILTFSLGTLLLLVQVLRVPAPDFSRSSHRDGW